MNSLQDSETCQACSPLATTDTTRLDFSSEPDFPVIPSSKNSLHKSKQNYSTHTLFNIIKHFFCSNIPNTLPILFTFNYFAFIKFNKQKSQLK